MAKEIEFSNLFGLLRAIKEGEGSEAELEKLLEEYCSGEKSENALEELGQKFCYVAIKGLYKYSEENSVKDISLIEKEEWDKKEVLQEINLPYYLVNEMIE